MPTRKIGPDEMMQSRQCRHPDHDPPTMRVFSSGRYEHECPACGLKQQFTVQEKYLAWVGAARVSADRLRRKILSL